MARGTPAFYEGTHAAGGGSADAMMTAIIYCLTTYQSNGEQAWELAKEIDGNLATYKAVYHSVGDRSLGSGANKGDTDIWIYLWRSGTSLYIATAQDYSPTDGGWSTAAYHAASSAAFVTIADATELNWWCVINEYEAQIIIDTGYYTSTAFGIPIRPHSAHMNGVGRITSQSGTGNGVSIGVDRDLTASLRAGQKVWLINQTPDLTSLQSVPINIVDVVSVGASTIVVDGVVNTYAIGSLLGYDPAANYIRTSGLTNCYCVSKLDGTWLSVTGQTMGMINTLSVLANEADIDPGPDGLYHCWPLWFKMSAVPSAVRGRVEHILMLGLGTQAAADLLRVDYDDAQRWQVFTTLPASLVTNWAAAYGPGATLTPGTTHEARSMDATPIVAGPTPGPDSPDVASVVALTPTTIKVTFVYPALDNVALRSPASYRITPALTIHAVTPEVTANPTYVILQIDEQKDLQVYDLELVRIEAAP